MIRDIITTIIFVALICLICYTNQNRDRLNIAEENRIKQNKELIQFQEDIQRLDIRLTRNEIKTRVLENKEIILISKDVLKKFEKDIINFEQAIKDYEERIKK